MVGDFGFRGFGGLWICVGFDGGCLIGLVFCLRDFLGLWYRGLWCDLRISELFSGFCGCGLWHTIIVVLGCYGRVC